MMYWNGTGHMGLGGWVLMAMVMTVLLALPIALAIVLRHSWIGPARVPVPIDPERSAEDVLAERFARGDIDETECRARRAALHEDDRS